jgi:hypothetical protein
MIAGCYFWSASWPSFKIVLPRGLLSMNGGGGSLAYFNVSRIESDTKIKCPVPTAQEADALSDRLERHRDPSRLERLECRFDNNGGGIISAALDLQACRPDRRQRSEPRPERNGSSRCQTAGCHPATGYYSRCPGCPAGSRPAGPNQRSSTPRRASRHDHPVSGPERRCRRSWQRSCCSAASSSSTGPRGRTRTTT